MTIIINLSNLESIPKDSPLYIRHREGNKKNGSRAQTCNAVCLEPPFYKCTRAKGHDQDRHTSRKGDSHDHIAHGQEGKMFARWNDEEGGKEGEHK